MSLLYFGLKKLTESISTIYFRNITVIGQENIPKDGDGPVIICGNHANQFIDPMMIMANCDRHISFTIAASSFKKPIIGPLAQSLHSIPVKRPEDSKIKGAGKIKFISPTELQGLNTEFLTESEKAGKGFSILINSKILPVDKITDNTNIVIKENKEAFENFKEKELDYFYIPKIDNSELFKEAYNILTNNGTICIFPEGTSHDRTEFIKLKAGIAFMALGAMSEFNCPNVKIVPAGLNYFKREKFRSEVVLEFGKPFEVPTEWGKEFKTNKRSITEALLKEIEARMRSVTLVAPSSLELRALHMLRRIYVPKDVKLTPLQHNELNKRFAKGYEKLKDQPECKEKIEKIFNYIRETDEIGINDYEICNEKFNQEILVKDSIKRFFLFFIYFILSLPGACIFYPFSVYIMSKAESERKAALAKNPNKIEAKDVVSSVKVVQTILCLPAMVLAWIILFVWFYNRYLGLFSLGYFYQIVLSLAIFPFYTYYGIKMADYVVFSIHTCYSRSIFFLFPKKLIRLKEEREKLGVEIREFVDKYATKIDPDYANRVVDSKKQNVDVSRDSFEQLMKRNSVRTFEPFMAEEIKQIIENANNEEKKSRSKSENLS